MKVAVGHKIFVTHLTGLDLSHAKKESACPTRYRRPPPYAINNGIWISRLTGGMAKHPPKLAKRLFGFLNELSS
jgi:hypothetical protein